MRAFLRRHRRIALDTSIFIYQVEMNPRYAACAQEVFAWTERPGHAAITSTITMIELLVQPYIQADEERVNAFFGLLSSYPNLVWVAPDLQIADTAARFRAQYRLRTPDALQAATAAQSQTTGFIANDAAFARLEAFETLLLDDLL